jgi:hypothetical protein
MTDTAKLDQIISMLDDIEKRLDTIERGMVTKDQLDILHTQLARLKPSYPPGATRI